MPSVDHRNAESVLEVFDASSTPYWSLVQGRDLKQCYDEDDIVDSREMLVQTLSHIEKSGAAQIFTLRFHKDGDINDKKKYRGSVNFQLVQPAAIVRDNVVYQVHSPASAPAADASVQELLRQMIALQQQQIQMLQDNEDDAEDDEDDEDEDVDEDVVAQQRIERITANVGSILNVLQPHLDAAANWIKNQFTNKNISGMEQKSEMDQAAAYDSINQSIATLVAKVGLEQLVTGLQKLASLEKGKLDIMLKML